MRTALHHLLDEQARARPDAAALTHRERSVTYAELAAEVHDLAAGLRSLGVQREDRVAVWLDKRVETVATMLATSAAGGVFVPVNPLLKATQVQHVLGDCDVTVLVTSRQRWTSLADVLADLPALAHVVLVDLPEGDPVEPAPVPVHQLGDVRASRGAAPATRPLDDDLAAVLYTSGSTGRPKGVVLSHRNLIVGAESVSEYLGLHGADVVLAALPLSFDAGLSQVTTAFSVGAHVVLLDYLLPGDVVRACATHGVTALTCVPPLWLQLTGAAWPDEARESLRLFANTGGRMPRTTLDRLRELFPQARPFLMYGLTEAFRSTYLDPAEVDRRPDSIGRAIPDAEILVVRPDGALAGPGEEGELVHRGPLVAQGYWGDVARTEERFKPVPGARPAWRNPERAVWSGDTVVADDEGYLYFVGREDEMIKTSGYRVSPTEVEEAAYACDGVGDAVVLGLEDDRLGQRIVLVVSPSAPDRELDPTALARSLRRALPSFMVPGQVLVLPSLPRSPNGKFDRVLLRKEIS